MSNANEMARQQFAEAEARIAQRHRAQMENSFQHRLAQTDPDFKPGEYTVVEENPGMYRVYYVQPEDPNTVWEIATNDPHGQWEPRDATPYHISDVMLTGDEKIVETGLLKDL